LVRKHQPLSTTLRSGNDRRNRVRSALQDLMDSSPTTQEVTFEWSQFNCLPNRAGGSSACSYITKSIMHGFMAGHLSLNDIFNDPKMRDLTVNGVEDCDASYPTRGDAPEMLPFLKEDLPATLRVTLETSCDKHEACRLLCREMPPACVAATAFKVTEDQSSDFVTRTGNTISILCEQNAKGFFDSHAARAWMVLGNGIRAAEALVDELHRHCRQQGCETGQLEFVLMVKDEVYGGCSDAVLHRLRPASVDPAFLDRFAKVAPLIVDRWTNRLDCMGDVDACWKAFTVLRHKEYTSAHWVPPWLCPSIFFIQHQLRFAELMTKFTQIVAETAALWEDQSEEAFEAALQKHMPEIMASTIDLWTETYNSDSFEKERAVVPNQLLKFIGGYKLGPHCWNWQSFPFRAIGRQLLCAMQPQCDVVKIRKSIIGLLPDEVHCSTYSTTHKIRTLAVCYGLLGSFQDSWCGCESMSAKNTELWAALGRPSAKEFQILAGRKSPAWELGYQFCFVASICQHYAKLIDEDWPRFKEPLQSLPGVCGPWQSPAQALNRFISPPKAAVDQAEANTLLITGRAAIVTNIRHRHKIVNKSSNKYYLNRK
jgi:hypothetical protein